MLKIDALNNLDKSDTMYLTIVAPKDGGLVIYESLGNGESSAVFGGNLEEATKYFNGRAEELQKRGPEKLAKALTGWQEWGGLPWEAKRPDIASVRHLNANAAISEFQRAKGE